MQAKMTLKINNAQKIIQRLGIEAKGRAELFLANEVARLSDPYIPFKAGILKNNKQISAGTIKYSSPYARYQYYGNVMVGRPPKRVTNIPLQYRGAPKRGKEWNKRMWIEKGKNITSSLQKFVGGK